jgi:hypothetical protein
MTQAQSTHEGSLVAIYDSHAAAEAAVKALQAGGVDMTRLSIVGKGFHTEEHAVGFYTAGDRVRFWGGRGAFWGSLWGMLFGSGFFLLPAIGPVLVMGPLVGWIVGVIEGAAVGAAAGALAAALASIGIPEDSIVKYQVELKSGKFLLLGRGNAAFLEQSRTLLEKSGASRITVHAPVQAAADAKRTEYVTRETVLKLLSDNEIAKVSMVEATPRLTEGDEYLDLEQLDRGVQRAPWTTPAIGRVLPRKSVDAPTWNKILAQLAARHAATPVAPSRAAS